LVIEVISPNDLAWEVEAKVAEYSRPSVPLIGVIYPDARTVWRYRASDDATRPGIGDARSGEDILPAFTYPVADVFPDLSYGSRPTA